MAVDDLRLPERAILLTLMAEAREVSNPELQELIGTPLDGRSRRKLNDANLVSSKKKDRSFVHELTEQGWRWCAQELASRYRPSGTTIGRAVYVVLAGLHGYLERSDLKPADVFGAGSGAAPVVDVDEQIRATYRKLAKEPRDWVSLSDLRPFLGDAPRAAVDDALRGLSRSRRANLIPQANQKILSQADRAAAVRIGTDDCHLISIEDA